MTDVLGSNLLPAAARTLARSDDLPSPAGVRPFGLTDVTVVPSDAAVSLDDLRYDPLRQVNVDSAGVPVAGPAAVIRMATTTDTKYDNQWFTDKD